MHLFAASRVLNFDDFSLEIENSPPWELQGQYVQVRGFWYPISSHESILASQPNLKSCCLKSFKIDQQLLVRGEIVPSSQRALTLEGVLKIEPRYDLEGQLVQLFILEQAREVPQSAMHMSMMSLGLFLILFCIWFFLKRRKNSFTSK